MRRPTTAPFAGQPSCHKQPRMTWPWRRAPAASTTAGVREVAPSTLRDRRGLIPRSVSWSSSRPNLAPRTGYCRVADLEIAGAPASRSTQTRPALATRFAAAGPPGHGAQTSQACVMSLASCLGAPHPLALRQFVVRIDEALKAIAEGRPGTLRRFARVVRRVEPKRPYAAAPRHLAGIERPCGRCVRCRGVGASFVG